MLKYCLKKWEANKDKLELSIRNDTAINSGWREDEEFTPVEFKKAD